MPRLLRGWLWKGLWAGGNVTSLPPVPGECLPFGQVMDHVWAVSFFPQLSFTTNAQLLLLRHEAAPLQWFVLPIFPLPKVKLTAVLYLLFHTGHHSDQVLRAFSSDIYASCRFLRGFLSVLSGLLQILMSLSLCTLAILMHWKPFSSSLCMDHLSRGEGITFTKLAL